MSEHSPNLQLPYILPSQAQKHVTHNEALGVLDAVVQASVLDKTLATPPAAPVSGACYIIADSATGAWAGSEASIAVWDNSSWLIITPGTGWRVWEQTANEMLVFDGTDWVTLMGPLQNIDAVGIHTTADATNRLSVASDASLFTHDGTDHQIKINKAADTDTASVLFQSNWIGRIEAGLAGNTDLSVKYSADGIAWNDGITLSSSTGFCGIGTATPNRELHISGNQTYMRIEDNIGIAGGTATTVCEFYDSAGQMGWFGYSAGSQHLHMRNLKTAGDIRMVGGTNFVISANGKVGIGTVVPSAKLHVLGDIKCSSLTETSDRRMKTNITKPAPTGAVIDDIRIVQYDWAHEDGHVPYGLVAQELAQVLPDAVVHGDDTEAVDEETLHWGVRQAPLVAMLIKEVQELRKRIATLETAA